jgi:hypothetical protein
MKKADGRMKWTSGQSFLPKNVRYNITTYRKTAIKAKYPDPNYGFLFLSHQWNILN